MEVELDSTFKTCLKPGFSALFFLLSRRENLFRISWIENLIKKDESLDMLDNGY